MTVVDLGTGTGRIPIALNGVVARVIGVDFSAASLEVARGAVPPGASTSYEFVLGDALSTGLPEGCADVVTSVQVLQHMPTEQARDGLLAAASRLLRPGGSLVITCYGRNAWHLLSAARESDAGGLYAFRHSRRDLKTRLQKRFCSVSVRAIIGLPDWVPSPRIDAWLSHAPGWGLVGRTLIGTGISREHRESCE